MGGIPRRKKDDQGPWSVVFLVGSVVEQHQKYNQIVVVRCGWLANLGPFAPLYKHLHTLQVTDSAPPALNLAYVCAMKRWSLWVDMTVVEPFEPFNQLGHVRIMLRVTFQVQVWCGKNSQELMAN